METVGESSSIQETVVEKPVVVRVKRKVDQSPLDAFWLEINERPFKRPLLDLAKLSISNSAEKEKLKSKKVLVRHVETVADSNATIDMLQSLFDSVSSEQGSNKEKIEERKNTFKRDNRKDQLLTKAVQQQQVAAKNARLEQIWRSRKGNKEGDHDKTLHEMCHFYDVVRVDVEEGPKAAPMEELPSLEEQKMLASYLPLLRELIPDAAKEIESDILSYMPNQTEEYVYDFYTIKDEMDVNVDDHVDSFPLVQVEDEDFYDGPDESEYESDDSNAEDNPRNDYPEEISDEEDEEEDDDDDDDDDEEEEEDSQASDESEDESSSYRYMRGNHRVNEDDEFDDYGEDGSEDEHRKWSYR
ncbi:PREDICTED: RNA-directed DNA methylation 4-like isoform X2 [Tarenaya hassleriana]|uniref:RNA-directed DNA methylation 4-like isoform X2 n=1 Tax=Tarenaya hassleriana TaxID=28532 RepID=UPI00053C6F64|nr:PREDICTED: RNA-directed DNA methylation 4-like isoform X2 [Tarenaya hassleriana]